MTKQHLAYNQITRDWRRITVVIVLMITLTVIFMTYMTSSQAESLFRAGVNYSASAPYRPHAIIAQPVPHAVGDIITIRINEQTLMSNTASLEIDRSQNVTENSSGLLNRIIHGLGVPQHWSLPDLNGVNSSNAMISQAEAIRQSNLQDNITCQVVQVLPNGSLVVQGTKSVLINKDRSDLMITGIVNPYYLDRNNAVDSTLVANFQMQTGGKGVLTRQQNDGLINKVYRLFH